MLVFALLGGSTEATQISPSVAAPSLWDCSGARSAG